MRGKISTDNYSQVVRRHFSLVLIGILLITFSYSTSYAENDITANIELIPIPEPPCPEIPLKDFQNNRESYSTDPEVTQLQENLLEKIHILRDRQELNKTSNQLETDVFSAERRQKSRTQNASKPNFIYKKKFVSEKLKGVKRTGIIPESQAKNNRRSKITSEKPLQVRMRSIGSPRQIKITDKENLRLLLPNSADYRSREKRDEQKVINFLNAFRSYLRLDDPTKELKVNKREIDDLDRHHFRFDQIYQGLPVWPAELIVHLDPEGNIDLVDGAFIPTPRKITTEPIIDAEEAISLARAHISGSETAEIDNRELIVYGPLDRPARLAWKIEMSVSVRAHWIVVVDALNQQILTAFNDVSHENVAGQGQDLIGMTRSLNVWYEGNLFYMIDTSKEMFDAAASPPRGLIQVKDAGNEPPYADIERVVSNMPVVSHISSHNPDSGWLRDAVSAAFNFSETYDYYLERHNRDSIDGNGCSINAVIRLGLNLKNAFWNTELKTMYFGDGMPFAGAMEVVAHELTHGVTQHSAGLVYHKQSGALNEAFSDIFGAMVEAYSEGTADWLIGEDLGRPSRSLEDPSSLGDYPEKMSQFKVLPDTKEGDNGGVHINCTIVSHAFYLLSEGMNGAIGMSDAEQIFYRALTKHLTRQSEFIDARLACIQSAKELFGNNSTQTKKTAEAFDMVEIYDSTPSPTPNPVPPASGSDAALFVAFDPYYWVYRLARREAALNDGNFGSWLSNFAIKGSRPSATADGSIAAVVTADSDLCLLLTDDPNSVECLGMSGLVHSVAMSPDGNYYGFVMLEDSGKPENRITFIDLKTENAQVFPLVAPVSDGLTINTVETADAMTFTADNRFLIYDALNILRTSDGRDIAAWSVYAIDLATENTLLIIPPVEGFDIGFPSIGNTSYEFITFEALNQLTGQSTVFAGNLKTGEIASIGAVNNTYAVPSYSGDDSAILYSVPDNYQTTMHSIYKQPLSDDHVTPVGAPYLWLPNADYAAIYRRGAYCKLSVENMDDSSGIVISNLGGINCGNSCSYIYPRGTAVDLTARTIYGSAFAGWGGSCSGLESCTVILDKDRSVTAAFIPEMRFTLADVVTLLRLMTGIDVAEENIPIDIDGDGKSGMSEIVYILQVIADIR